MRLLELLDVVELGRVGVDTTAAVRKVASALDTEEVVGDLRCRIG